MEDNFYIFTLNDKKIKSIIYDLGTVFDRIDCTLTINLISERNSEQKEIDEYSFIFLLENKLIDDFEHRLTKDGKELFEALYVYNDKAIFKNLLLESPVVNLIGQVYYGRGKIPLEQLLSLLNYHKVSQEVLTLSNIVSLLTLLNSYEIVSYDKKNRMFSIKEQSFEDFKIKQYFVDPTTPFSNIYNLRKCIRGCLGTLYWIDKHFRKQGFEILLDGLPPKGINDIIIISDPENATESAKVDYKNLKDELTSRKINLEWGIIRDDKFKWHDRWLISDNVSYNIPPVLAIINGRRAEIIKTEEKIDVSVFLTNCEFLEV